jgi:hypothetical protein
MAMSSFDQILDWGPVARIRRNHGLEHATLQVLAERVPGLRMAGYSDQHGFWLIGQAETDQVIAAAELALARLNGGEHTLAIHPHCGTNLVTTGLLAGSFAWLGMLSAGRNLRERIERLPFIITLVTLAVFISQPLGPYLQARVTTSPAVQGMSILRVERSQRGEMPMFHVITRF